MALLSVVWSELEKGAANDPMLSGLLDQYADLSKTNNHHIVTLVQLYEQELRNQQRENISGLTLTQTAVVRAEMQVFEKECDFGIRDKYGERKFCIPSNAIDTLPLRVKEKCPLLTCIYLLL